MGHHMASIVYSFTANRWHVRTLCSWTSELLVPSKLKEEGCLLSNLLRSPSAPSHAPVECREKGIEMFAPNVSWTFLCAIRERMWESYGRLL